MNNDFSYIQTDIPEGMTIDEYRRSRFTPDPYYRAVLHISFGALLVAGLQAIRYYLKHPLG